MSVTLATGNATGAPNGTAIATDQIAGVEHQLVKLEFGQAGSATPVSSANPLPTTIPAAGLGSLAAVPAGSTNGTPIGAPPAGASGVRLYLPGGASVSFTIASAQPASAPANTFTVSNSSTGPNWDEPLNGQNLYITAIAGAPLFRWC